MLKVFGHPTSTCTRKVLMTLAETSTPFEMNIVDLGKGDHKREPHIGRQPFGRVPALEDDGYALFESRAICRYLSKKRGAHLLPSDARALGRMEQWISVETSEFTPHAMKFIYQYVFKRPQEAAVLDAAGNALEATCGVMDVQLAATPFIAGSEFSLADICYMPYLEYAMGTPARESLSKFVHLSEWWTRISARPTWLTVAGRG